MSETPVRHPINPVKWAGQVGWQSIFLSLLTDYTSYFLKHEKKKKKPGKFKKYERKAAHKTCEKELQYCNLHLCVKLKLLSNPAMSEDGVHATNHINAS